MHVLVRRCLFGVFIISTLALTSCATNKKTNTAGLDEQRLYESAQRSLKRGDNIAAVDFLQKLEADFPFGKFAQPGQLSLIYAYFKSKEQALVNATARRFIRLHPNHPDVDYAYYMLGLNVYPKPGSLFQSVLGTDLSRKDTNAAKASFTNFSEFVNRFPKSEYAADAIKRLEFLRNLLARSEINVANYYLSRKAFLSAANRGRFVVENYQGTPAVPDALAIMIQGYHALKMQDLAQSSLQVLQLNYPGYPALRGNGDFNYNYYVKDTRSLLGLTTFGLIDNSKPPGFDTRKKYGRF